MRKNERSCMSRILSIQNDIDRLSIHEHAFMKSTDVIFSEEVRDICKQNKCGMYGSSWACPPVVGSVEECKAQCLAYEHGGREGDVGKILGAGKGTSYIPPVK
jgi:hypothetical protein